MKRASKRYLNAAVGGLVVAIMLTLVAILVRSVVAMEGLAQAVPFTKQPRSRTEDG